MKNVKKFNLKVIAQTRLNEKNMAFGKGLGCLIAEREGLLT